MTNLKEWLDSMDTFVFDCDGVLWLGSTLIPQVKEVLEKLQSRSKRLLFVSNNSSQSRRLYVEKFKSLGLQVDAVGHFTF
jgi:4-nitrophenyl phosphatase